MNLSQLSKHKINNRGFSLVELVVIIAVLVVLLAILAPFLLRYVENSRIQKDESSMDELCGAIKLAMSDAFRIITQHIPTPLMFMVQNIQTKSSGHLMDMA